MPSAKRKSPRQAPEHAGQGGPQQLDLLFSGDVSASNPAPIRSSSHSTRQHVEIPVQANPVQAKPFVGVHSNMNPHEKYFVRELFKSRILAANGAAFEKLFTEIWTYAHSGFRQIKPQGKRGDKKNDGYLTDKGEYYQVYAPENSSDNVSKAVKKLEGDFAGLKAYWDRISPVRAYRFVFNDKYDGSFPEIESACARLKSMHNLDECRVILAADLEATLFNCLSDDQIFALVGSIPRPELFKGLDYRGLRDVIEHLLHRLKPQNLANSPLVAPDFEDKIKFNALGERYAILLRSGNRYSGELDVYFGNQGDFQRDQIHRIFKDLYQSARQKIVDGEGDLTRSDRIFVDIFQQALPKGQHTFPVESAVFVLMAYYFETCDIFEEPRRSS
jgi:hypothetical protein